MTLATVLDEIRGRKGTSDIIPIFDPSLGEQIGEFADGGSAAVHEAVARARASFKSGVWHGKTSSERSRILWRVGELIQQHVEELADIDARNGGAPLKQSRSTKLASAEFFRYCAGWCTKINGIAHDVRMAGGITGSFSELHGYTLKQPIGVVGLIVPWNGPFHVAACKIAPALAAGCSCVLKPAENTPLSADEDEVIVQANDTIYGLAATAWTRDLGRAHRLAKRMDAGMITLNCQMVWDPALPLGGHKQSGWGYEYGIDGIEAYMTTKCVYTQL